MANCDPLLQPCFGIWRELKTGNCDPQLNSSFKRNSIFFMKWSRKSETRSVRLSCNMLQCSKLQSHSRSREELQRTLSFTADHLYFCPGEDSSSQCYSTAVVQQHHHRHRQRFSGPGSEGGQMEDGPTLDPSSWLHCPGHHFRHTGKAVRLGTLLDSHFSCDGGCFSGHLFTL